MEFVFLGTGAAEGVPAAYCRCPACQGVRGRGGIEIKTRSSARIGPHHQIDIGPDHYGQMSRAGVDMYDVEHILVTHSHEDHFDFYGLSAKQMTRETNNKPINVYVAETARGYLEGMLESMKPSANDLAWIAANIVVHGLRYFSDYTIGGFTVHTVKANHTAHGVGEYAINYLIEMPHGRTLLYACDTGYYADETWAYLEGRRVDTLIMECTFAGKTDRPEFPGGHLDLPSYFKTLERMEKIGFIDARTSVYATHFNPHQGLDHNDIHKRLQDSRFHAVAAYDGLRAEV
jgi:phosphoribosyl 1,2-cyclic phosphate phosphodiesterase